MYRTSNSTYGNHQNTSESKKTNSFQASQSQSRPYGFNWGQTAVVEEYRDDYYSSSNKQYNNSGTNDFGSYSSQPQFNVGFQSHQESSPYTLSNFPMTKAISSGLPNLGNTCYLNSTLQCLINTKKLLTYFINGNNLIDASNPELTHVFGQLAATIFSKTASDNDLYPVINAFKRSIGELNPVFKGFSQNDAHEIFRFILEKMHKELNQARLSNQAYTEFKVGSSVSLSKHAEEWIKFSKARDNSIINSTFEGSLLSEVVCDYCKNKSYTFENTLDLSLDIPKDSQSSNKGTLIDLAKCLVDFTSEINVMEYMCSKCNKKRKSKRRVTIWKQPEILVIQLKRFIYDKYGQLEALKDRVSFPLTSLDLQVFTHSETKKSKEKYRLYGIVNHYGTLDSGHYTSTVYNEDENSWLLYDDDKVSRLDRSDIEKYAQGSPNPYILFYKRV